MKTLSLWIMAILALFFNMASIRLLKDQRGETAPDDPPDDLPTDDIDEIEEDNNVSLDLTGEGDEDLPVAGEDEKKEEKAEVPDEIQKQLDSFKEQLDKDKEIINNLKKAVSEERAKNRATKEEKDVEPPLTEAQILALYKEHKDDPDILFNIVKYQIEQGTKKAKTEAVDVAEISRITKDIESELTAKFPDLTDDDSDLRKGVNETKSRLRIIDHPYSDLLAIGVMAYHEMPQLLEKEFERGKAEALKVKTEEKRKETIKNGKLGDGKGLKTAGGLKLNANHMDTANRIGLSEAGKKRYAQILGNSSRTAEV